MDLIYKKLINKYKDSILIDILLNIILVNENVRPSFLLESSNYANKIENYMDDVNIILKKINKKNSKKLKTYDDNSNFIRTFIYLEDSFVDNNISENPESVNDDFWIAVYLGFNCRGHNYSDYLNDRIVIKYVDKQNQNIVLITEVCEKNKDEKHIKKKSKLLLDKINKILNKFDFIIELQIDLDLGVKTRYKKLLKNDIKFLKKYKYEYINDFENFYISDESILKKSVSYKKLKDIKKTTKIPDDIEKLALLYYNACINNYFDKYYAKADNFDKITEVANNILEFDIKYWDIDLDCSKTMFNFINKSKKNSKKKNSKKKNSKKKNSKKKSSKKKNSKKKNSKKNIKI